ncbi:cyclase family protein [Streptomyces sp. LX-29]|uniref:cyclase family protein n=1 Tax=Streptomyces sp. LX-29 TaxID=2900152 RepID=UPI00240E6571|nr:cyclase family protein [Streptomyces sp. LX-29]WFB11250.1 cyclase family protein [Streptomyces sp. LX-29]
MTDHSTLIDADVTLADGGSLRVRGFPLDVPRSDLPERQVVELLVAALRLGPADRVRLCPGTAAAERDREVRAPSRLVDLSHVITEGMVTLPGLPGPVITPHLTRKASRAHYEAGTEFAIDRISMVGNTGTYLDSPFHRYPDRADLADLPLDAVADLPVVVVPGPPNGERGIGPDAFDGVEVAGAAVLLHTGWDRHFGTEAYGRDAPYLTGDGARALAEADARLVGIDSANIDDMRGDARPAHSVLLDAGIPVLEHLTRLDHLPRHGARLHAAAPRVRGFGTFPVRAYAVVPGVRRAP